MSKLLLRILLCAGYSLCSFPISSTESDAPNSRNRSSSAPKKEPKFLKDLAVTQEKAQEKQKPLNEINKLTAEQIVSILNSPHSKELGSTEPVSIGTNFEATAKHGTGLELLKQAICQAYNITVSAFEKLSKEEAKRTFPTLSAVWDQDLQIKYNARTVGEKQKAGYEAEGTLQKFMLKVGDKPLEYSLDGPFSSKATSKMITACLELSITKFTKK